MSLSLMLFLIAIAAAAVLFADSAAQWSLRALLAENIEFKPEVAGSSETKASQASAA